MAFLRAKISADPKFLLVRCPEPALNFPVNSQLFKNIGLPLPCKFFYHYPNFCLIECYHIWWNSNCLCYLWQYCYSICSGKRQLWICDPFQSALPSSMFLAAITGFSSTEFYAFWDPVTFRTSWSAAMGWRSTRGHLFLSTKVVLRNEKGVDAFSF